MKDIKEKINTLNKTINEVQDEKYSSIFKEISGILDELNEKVEKVMVNEAVLAENFKYMDDDIQGLQEELFEEVSLEDLDEIEDEYKEIPCAHCGKTLFIESSALKDNKKIPCPYCNKNAIEK